MKRWTFSLEAVRALKERLEQEAAQKHAQALLRQSHCQKMLDVVLRKIDAAAKQAQTAATRQSTGQLFQIRQYLTALDQERQTQAELCREAGKAVVLARENLEKAAREREILDRLSARRKAEHDFHIAQQEQKWLDELAQRIRQPQMFSPAVS